jgi:hypothetical protein
VGCIIDRDGNGQVYINGFPSGSPVSLSSPALDTTSDLVIGTRSYTPTNYFNGMLDDFKIFNYALIQIRLRLCITGGAEVFKTSGY